MHDRGRGDVSAAQPHAGPRAFSESDRLTFHVFGALAEFERNLIIDRTQAGLAAARAKGRKGGRKPVATPERIDRARAMIARGLTVREAAARLRIGKTALYAVLREAPACQPRDGAPVEGARRS